MGLRGFDSEAALKIVTPPEFQERAKPPAGMTAPAAGLWREIVASLPATWFRPGDLPLLRAYCESCALNARACRAMGKAATVKTAAGGKKQSPWNSIRNATTSEMALLSTKLRLAVNSRTPARRADVEGEQPPASKRGGLMFGG